MDNYKLSWKPSVEKDLKRINKSFIPRIIREAERLCLDPHPADSKKLRDTQGTYRKRIGDYRIIYQVD